MSDSRDPRSSGIVHTASGPQGRSSLAFLHELAHCISEHDLFGRSAQLAYFFFFAVFPGLIFLYALLAILSGPGSPLHASLMEHLPSVLPPKVVGLMRHTLQKTHDDGGKITFGVLVALWSATAGMAATCKTLNEVHEVKESRPYWRVWLTALLLTIGVSLLLLCAIVVFFWGDIIMLQSSLGGNFHALLTGLTRAAQWAVTVFVIAVIFALVYYFAPDIKERKWHWITPGASLGVAVWILATIGLRIYLRYFDSYSATYGSLGAVIIVLAWFYADGFAFLLGAELNTIKENKAAEEGNPEATEKGERSPKTV